MTTKLTGLEWRVLDAAAAYGVANQESPLGSDVAATAAERAALDRLVAARLVEPLGPGLGDPVELTFDGWAAWEAGRREEAAALAADLAG